MRPVIVLNVGTGTGRLVWRLFVLTVLALLAVYAVYGVAALVAGIVLVLFVAVSVLRWLAGGDRTDDTPYPQS